MSESMNRLSVSLVERLFPENPPWDVSCIPSLAGINSLLYLLSCCESELMHRHEEGKETSHDLHCQSEPKVLGSKIL